ncbi:MAG TPA: sporulation protein [Iamia sp.]|jgi:sporulation-control protein|nr:sporulation protein [Iamia sp.]
MFKKLKQAFGVGGPSVDTVLAAPSVYPGGILQGEVRITGGSEPRDFNHLTLSLAATVEVESGDDEYLSRLLFANLQVAGAGRLEANVNTAIPFQMEVPWEAPFNNLRGRRFENMKLGVQTRFDLPGGRDATDFDPIDIHPLPVHDAVVASMERLGFTLKSADLEKGTIAGSSLGFYNEVEFRGQGKIPEAELTFVTGPVETRVVVELQRRGLLASRDRHSTLAGPTNEMYDWDSVLRQHLDELARASGKFFG